jgi:diphthamide synthase subunit DPH2
MMHTSEIPKSSKILKVRKIKQVLSGDGYQCVCGRGHKERVKEGEYGGCILYSCMKIE